MITPKTISDSIIINGVLFKTYSAEDSHGSRAKNFYVDNKLVSAEEFKNKLTEVVGASRNMILTSLKAFSL